MNCPHCNSLQPDGAQACSACGGPLVQQQYPQQGYQQQGGYAPQGGYPPPGYQQPYGAGYVAPRTSGMAIAGFVLSFFCALLGIIFSAVALSQIAKSNGALTGKGLATAGLVLSIVFIFLNIVLLASGGIDLR